MLAAPDLIIAGGYLPEISVSADADATRREGRPTAIAITGDRISAIGGEDLRTLASGRTRVVEASGGAILPGLNDAHLHFCASAIVAHSFIDLSGAANWGEVRALLDATPSTPDGWIRARGWDDARLGSGGVEAVFEARPDTCVVAHDQTGHQLLLNEAAVRRAGIDQRDTGTVAGVGRFDDGRANGHLVDGAMALVSPAIPDLAPTTVREALLAHQRTLHSHGITSLTEPGLGPGGTSLIAGSCGTPSLEALTQLAADGGLALRITALALFSGTGGASLEETLQGLGGDLLSLPKSHGVDPLLLRVAGVKVFADGTPRSGTAWMAERYVTPCGHGHGHLVTEGGDDRARLAELTHIIQAVHRAGLQLGIHATGDAATAAAVEAIIDAQRHGVSDARHYIIHGAFGRTSDLRQLARHGIGYSTNPSIRAGAGALIRSILGDERFAEQQPLRTALGEGVHANIASDAPVTSADWRESVAAAVTRDTTAGPGNDDPERLSLSQALALMTRTPAWQDHAEQHKGRLVAGQLADVCVLSGPLTNTPSDLHNLPTALTVVGGKIVHQPETSGAF